MKIIIDARSLTSQNYSGVAIYTLNLIRALLAQDTPNDYVLFANDSRGGKLPSLVAPNLRLAQFSYPSKLFNTALILSGRPRLDLLAGGGDIFFAPNLNFLSWSNYCRRVLTVHDLSFLRFPEFFTAKMRLWHHLVKFRQRAKEADAIIADSQNTKRDIVELLGVAENKIKVIYAGVEENFFTPVTAEAKQELRAKHNLPRDFALFLGTNEPRKNLAGAISAFTASEVNGVLAVAGPVGWKTGRQGLAGDKIKFIGYVAEADKAALYQSAKCLIYPSYYEGFGLPIVEAMASGCPVICGANSSQVEVAGDSALLIDPLNISEIAVAVTALWQDEQLRVQLIAKGRARAQRFSWSEAARQTLEIFKQVKK